VKHLLLAGLIACLPPTLGPAWGHDRVSEPPVEADTNARAPLQLILLGGPGAGKGTQARRLAESFGICHISTGEMLRAEVTAGTELGQEVAALMERGELVADGIILQLVANRARQPDCQDGFILDGFPRTIGQAQAVEEALERLGRPAVAALLLEVSDQEMFQRLAQRGRADDTAETIRHRIEVFHQQTDPLVAYYEEKEALLRVDGEQSIERVAQAVAESLAVD
jgi:adenylate kinase